MQSIIICATVGRTNWLSNCIRSFKGYNKYPIISLMVNGGKGYIPDFIRTINQMGIDEYVLLQDSMEVKDPEIFDICFEQYRGVSVSLSRTPTYYGSTHGKFITSITSQCSVPNLTTKYEDALFEVSFGQEYHRLSKDNFVDLCDLEHTDKFIEKYGRKNMVTENKWIRKLKGTWTIDMAKII